jgi:hypothetical protein
MVSRDSNFHFDSIFSDTQFEFYETILGET